jgi:pimeloyl-ACP methyl ester carboxylesterase
MSRVAHVIYLHGFASSPSSSKATRFQEELEQRGVGFSCPDFNLPAFETLTITRMLDQTRDAIARAAAPGPIALVGSSLGGFVALHAAAMDGAGRIDRLILLAPALEFGGNRLRQLGEHGIEEWRRSGRIRVFHYSREEEQDIGFGLYEDAASYDALALNVQLPMLVYQGRHDDSVSPAMVEEWARRRTNVELHLVEDDHQLTASMDEIWARSAEFLGVAPETGPRPGTSNLANRP